MCSKIHFGLGLGLFKRKQTKVLRLMVNFQPKPDLKESLFVETKNITKYALQLSTSAASKPCKVGQASPSM